MGLFQPRIEHSARFRVGRRGLNQRTWILWLCSKENSFTTAGVFDLSGGRATY
jgi:hypothetical protein